MRQECDFHQERPALWHCPECPVFYCSECIPGGEDNFSGGEPRCPLCSKSLAYLGGGIESDPFWRRGSDLLRYGLRAGPRGVAVFAGLMLTFGLSPHTFVLLVFGYVVVASYGLEITVRMAQGSWQPPRFEQAYRDNKSLSMQQMLLLLVLFALPVLASLTSSVLAGLLYFLVMLVVPAAIMLLALRSSLLVALNPLMHSRLIATVGWPYLLLWFALGAITAVPDLAALAMGDQTAVVLPVFVINLLTCYSLLVAYALMGYLLYQYAGELGFAERQQRGRSLPPEEYQRKAALGQSHIYARRGRLKDALGVINRALAAQSTNIRLHEHKHRLLMSLKRPAKLTAHASEYVRILVAAGNPGNATAVLKNVWQQEPDFRLDDPSAALAIARVFHQQQQFREARRMLANLHRDHPEFEQLGEAYLLLARVYLEGYDSRDHVKRILGFLRKNRPQMLDSEDGHYLRRMVAD